MAVFRVEKTRDYTVMANHHLRNLSLSLKAKGLLSLMLSLPDKWDYTTKGLARICKDGVDSICTTVKELEEHGYVIRERIRNDKGQIIATQYTILEQPKPPSPEPENPVLGNPSVAKPAPENPDQLNTDQSSMILASKDQSNPIPSNQDWIGMDAREAYRETILENIEYEMLSQDRQLDRDRLDEIVELLVDTVCSARQTIRISGDDFPAEAVRSRLLKLDSSHILYVLECMANNTTHIRNIRKYLLAALFNASATMGSYYSAQVNHDLYGSIRNGSPLI